MCFRACKTDAHVVTHPDSIRPTAQVGDDADMFFRGIDQSDPANQARMLQALNQTLHTPYVNATLSAFDNNWCVHDASAALLLNMLNIPYGTRHARLMLVNQPVCHDRGQSS